MNTAIEASGLGKRFGRRWALRDCSFTIPAGRVVAVVGANGAGKSTLLNVAANLIAPTTGTLRLLDTDVSDRAKLLNRVGFVAQDVPLYRGFSVVDTLEVGRRLNRRWDGLFAAGRLRELGIEPDQKVGALSGGQRAQVALVMALARRPDILLLDEPVAALDPLARRSFLSLLMQEVASRPLTIVLSSHLIADLERTCDYLVVLGEGQVRVLGAIDKLIDSHWLLSGQAGRDLPPGVSLIQREQHGSEVTALVRTHAEAPPLGWQGSRLDLEELVLAYIAKPSARALPGPARAAVEAAP